ncbi:MAG: MotA/TolQ/ExbB proton channel family protein [Verrucomicrobiota bacterium]
MGTGIFDVIQQGGIIMGLIFVASVIAVGVFAERLFFFHRSQVPVGEFLKGITALIKQKKYAEALDRCDEAYGPAVKVIQSALIKRDMNRTELRETVTEVAQLQVPRLEANLGILATIAHVCPLLGLFGTVTGMIQAFIDMSAAGGAAPVNELSGGIWEALVTTAGGLGVAIPVYVAYNFLSSRAAHIVSDMERAGIEILHLLAEVEEESGDSKKESEIPKDVKSAIEPAA